jgi:hypothetical protein
MEIRYMRDRNQFDIRLQMAVFQGRGLDWSEVAQSGDSMNAMVVVMWGSGRYVENNRLTYIHLAGSEKSDAADLIRSDLAACGSIPAP